MNTEDLVSAYISIRSQREALLRQYEEQDSALKQELSLLEQTLLAVCNEVNANSLRTDAGTVIRKVNERFFCNDWDNFYKFIRQHDAVELLERRIHQGNFKQFLAANEESGLPPGVNVMREYGVTVRKPSA
ncbi:hypothetical protein EBT31_14825 [bacterium]|nr:hypothetical protein [bacterium]